MTRRLDIRRKTYSKYRAKPGWYDADLRPCEKSEGRYYFRSKLEAEYAGTLHLRKKAGDILNWRYESLIFNLDECTNYKPDFFVVLKDGTEELHEVKGMITPDARRKLKLFLIRFPEYTLKIKTRDGLYDAAEYLKGGKRKWKKK